MGGLALVAFVTMIVGRGSCCWLQPLEGWLFGLLVAIGRDCPKAFENAEST